MDKLKDPADKASAAKEKDRQTEAMKKFDTSKIRMLDFERIPKKRARVVHPFDGYPLKPPIDIGNGVEISKTFIVALDPRSEPPQDPSGLRMSIINQKTGKEEIKDIRNPHSRFIKGPDRNEDVVFDRELEVDGKIVHYAIIKDHAVRARVCYYYNTKVDPARFEVDDRYMLLDISQAANLMRLFQNLTKPALRRELQAAGISGEAEISEKQLEAVPTEA